jgi:hypothetical protein
MEASGSSKKSLGTYLPDYNILRGCNGHTHHCKYLKSDICLTCHRYFEAINAPRLKWTPEGDSRIQWRVIVNVIEITKDSFKYTDI